MPANAVSLIPIKTRPLVPPRDDLWEALAPVLPVLQEGDVLAITSKVVAVRLKQGRALRPPIGRECNQCARSWPQVRA